MALGRKLGLLPTHRSSFKYWKNSLWTAKLRQTLWNFESCRCHPLGQIDQMNRLYWLWTIMILLLDDRRILIATIQNALSQCHWTVWDARYMIKFIYIIERINSATISEVWLDCVLAQGQTNNIPQLEIQHRHARKEFAWRILDEVRRRGGRLICRIDAASWCRCAIVLWIPTSLWNDRCWTWLGS